MNTKKEYKQFLNEKFAFSATNDKCPLFYIFVKSKLISGVEAEQLEKDEKLVKLLSFIKKEIYDELELEDKKCISAIPVLEALKHFNDKSMGAKKNVEAIKTTIDELFNRIEESIDVFSKYRVIVELREKLLKSVEFKEFCDSL